jgi:hypothetical protein
VPIFDALSTKFGITAEELFEMSKNGDITAEHLTDAFKSMTSEGGVFFNGMENSSDTFNMRLLGLQENVGLVAAEIGEKFLPGLKDVLGAAGDAVAKFSEWIGEGENLDYLLATLGYTLAGVTAGLAAFLVVSKGHTVVTAMTVAVKALTGALAANPIGAVAIAVTTVAVPAFIALAKHIDESQHKVRTLNKELETQKNIYSTAVTALDGLGKGKTLDAETTEKLVRLYPELTGKIEAYKTATEDATKMVVELDRAKKTDKINEMVAAYVKETEALQNQTEKVAAAERRLASVRKESTLYDSASMTLSALEKEFERMKQQAEQSRMSIATAYQGIGEELVAITNGQALTKPLEKLPEEAKNAGAAGGENAGTSFSKNLEKTLADKLKNVKLTPEQDLAQDMAEFEAYLNKMADMENLSGEARVAAIESQEQRIRKDAKLTADEQIALKNAVTAATDAARTTEAAKDKADQDKKITDEQKGYDDYAKSLADRLSISERYRALNRDAEGDDYNRQLADAAALYAEEQKMLLDQQSKLNELTLMDGDTRAAENERINLEMLESNKKFADTSAKIEETAAAASKKVLEERMNAAINFIGAVQSVFNSISSITNGFLEQQQEIINADSEAEKESINARYKGLLEEEGYSAEELQALLDSANAKKLAGEQLTADERKAVQQKMSAEIAASEAKFAVQQAELDKKKKEEAHKAAVFNRVLAIAQVPIATAQAILKAIADFGPPPSPLGIAGIAAASAIGGAQMAALIASPIPSAETGGRFVVPHTATGVDSGLLRVNEDEVATITPRGGVAEGGGARIIINLDGRPIVDLMNVNLRSGDIYETSPAWA